MCGHIRGRTVGEYVMAKAELGNGVGALIALVAVILFIALAIARVLGPANTPSRYRFRRPYRPNFDPRDDTQQMHIVSVAARRTEGDKQHELETTS